MVLAPPPDWLKPGAIAYHIPTSTLFIAERLTSNGTSYRLYDAPGNLQGNAYELSDCRPPSLEDCVATVLFSRGQSLSVVRADSLLIVSDGKTRVGIRLFSMFDRAVQNFANFFRGEIIQGNPDEILNFGGDTDADAP